MSHLLWKYFWDQDVDKFRRLLEPSLNTAHGLSKSPGVGNNPAYLVSSPVAAPAAYPRHGSKQRKLSALSATPGKSKDAGIIIGRSEINSRDHAGLSILLRVASSTKPTASEFARALLDHPAIDVYIQDAESGWNALHRSLYAGNVSIARMLLERERRDLMHHTRVSVSKVGQLIKTKDHEGHSPFDLYNSTIAGRSLKEQGDGIDLESSSDFGDSQHELTNELVLPFDHVQIGC